MTKLANDDRAFEDFTVGMAITTAGRTIDQHLATQQQPALAQRMQRGQAGNRERRRLRVRDSIRQRGDVMSGGSYESSNDQRLHFGLAQAAAIDAVEVHWPSGVVEKVNLPSVDRFFAIEEGKGVVPSVYDGIAKNVHPAPQ